MGIAEQITGSRVSMGAGGALTRRNQIAFDQGITVTDDSANGVTRVSVAQQVLNVADSAVMGTPMLPGLASNQGARLQHAIDIAAGRPIFIPAGHYDMGDNPVIQTPGEAVAVVGAAMALGTDAATVLDFTGLGSGKTAIDLGGTATWLLENVAIVGPGSYVVGTDITDRDGVHFNGRGYCIGVCIAGFRSGGRVLNDHMRFIHSTFDGNTYGLNWYDTTGLGEIGLGDIVIKECSLSHNAKAGIAIHSSNAVANILITQTHFGNGPYCIWRYGNLGDTHTQFLANFTSINNSYESHGNGIIVDGVGDGRIANIVFINFAEANGLTGGARWPGKSVRAAIDVDQIYGMRFIGGDLPYTWGASDTGGLADDGTTPIARVSIRANTKARIWTDVAGPVGDIVNSDALFFADGAAPAEAVDCELTSAPGSVAVFKRLTSGETITQFDLLEMVGAHQIRTYRGGYPVGVATAARTTEGSIVAVIKSGFSGGLIKMRVASGNSVASGNLLKPDPSNNGRVKAAANYADGPIVGRADSSVTGPGLVEVEVLP